MVSLSQTKSIFFIDEVHKNDDSEYHIMPKKDTHLDGKLYC